MSTDHESGGGPLPAKTAVAERMQALRERPRTSAEISGTFTDSQRQIVCRLHDPAAYSKGGGGGGSTRALTVYYLWGDERRAVRRFIHENTDYVTDVFEDATQHTVFHDGWDGVLVSLLKEELQLRGEGA